MPTASDHFYLWGYQPEFQIAAKIAVREVCKVLGVGRNRVGVVHGEFAPTVLRNALKITKCRVQILGGRRTANRAFMLAHGPPALAREHYLELRPAQAMSPLPA